MTRRVSIWLAWRAALMGLFLLLSAKADPPYIVAAAIASCLAAGAGVGLMRLGLANPDARLGWIRLLSRLPGPMLRDCGVLTGVLWRRIVRGEYPASLYREVPFDSGLEHDREAMARRACVTAAASLAPNTIVIGVAPDHLLVHQLVPTPVAPGRGDRKWPV